MAEYDVKIEISSYLPVEDDKVYAALFFVKEEGEYHHIKQVKGEKTEIEWHEI